MKLNLPLHPSKLHPLTGRPLEAVGVLPSGRVVWPILGAADPTPEEKAAADAAAAAAQKATDDAAAAKKAADDAAAAAAAGGKDAPAPTKLQPSDPDYFPANTPVKDMPIAQQAAYWKWNSKKHEDRATDWRTKVGGGKKTADEVAAELEAQRVAALSEHDRAIEEARKAGIEEGRQSTASAMSTSMATLAFETAMAHVPSGERADLIADVNLSRVIREDGSIDTDKVASIVARIAPANGKGPRDPDFGGGSRGTGNSGSGVGAGQSRYRERHAKKTSTTS